MCNGQANGFSSDFIAIEIKSPDCPDLTLIDLPGIVRTAVSGQSQGVITEVKPSPSCFFTIAGVSVIVGCNFGLLLFYGNVAVYLVSGVLSGSRIIGLLIVVQQYGTRHVDIVGSVHGRVYVCMFMPCCGEQDLRNARKMIARRCINGKHVGSCVGF